MTLTSDVSSSLGALDLSVRTLRRFGLLVGSVLLALGLWLGRGQGAHPAVGPGVLAALGAALVLLGLAAPSRLGVPYRAWMGLAFTLGWFTSRLLLALIFFGVVTPIGLLARLVGKRFLELAPDRGAASYWVRRDPARGTDHRKLS